MEEVTKELGISISNLSSIMKNFGKDLSLDEMISEDHDSTLLDFIPDDKSPLPDNSLMSESLKIEVSKVLDSLPRREGEILRLYYGISEGRTLNLTEIGERLNLSRERVRQIKELSLNKLRRTSKGKMLRQFLG
jgi:RNA polymerase primary sigma factor